MTERSEQEHDPDAVDRTAGAIRGRTGRICNVVAAEMDNYEPGKEYLVKRLEMRPRVNLMFS